jgi:hypothetical protein
MAAEPKRPPVAGFAAFDAPNNDEPKPPTVEIGASVGADIVVPAPPKSEPPSKGALVVGVAVLVPPKSEPPSKGAGLAPVSVDSGRVEERFNGDEANKPPDGAAEGVFPNNDILKVREAARRCGCAEDGMRIVNTTREVLFKALSSGSN